MEKMKLYFWFNFKKKNHTKLVLEKHQRSYCYQNIALILII